MGMEGAAIQMIEDHRKEGGLQCPIKLVNQKQLKKPLPVPLVNHMCLERRYDLPLNLFCKDTWLEISEITIGNLARMKDCHGDMITAEEAQEIVYNIQLACQPTMGCETCEVTN